MKLKITGPLLWESLPGCPFLIYPKCARVCKREPDDPYKRPDIHRHRNRNAQCDESGITGYSQDPSHFLAAAATRCSDNSCAWCSRFPQLWTVTLS